MKRSVYLCGPVTGMTKEGANDWRAYVQRNLADTIIGLNPMRDTADLAETPAGVVSDAVQLARLWHGKAVTARDRMDVASCDVVLANVLGAQQVSIGSVGEIFWADAYRKPVVLVREAHGNPHDHDMINSIISSLHLTLDDAIAKVNRMLGS